VPFFDVELVGIPALGYVGAQSFDDDTFGYLLNDPQQRVVICGGKGGVGKVGSLPMNVLMFFVLYPMQRYWLTHTNRVALCFSRPPLARPWPFAWPRRDAR
jgi:hypothetical protein